jgi:hypothetical protein
MLGHVALSLFVVLALALPAAGAPAAQPATDPPPRLVVFEAFMRPT